MLCVLVKYVNIEGLKPSEEEGSMGGLEKREASVGAQSLKELLEWRAEEESRLRKSRGAWGEARMTAGMLARAIGRQARLSALLAATVMVTVAAVMIGGLIHAMAWAASRAWPTAASWEMAWKTRMEAIGSAALEWWSAKSKRDQRKKFERWERRVGQRSQSEELYRMAVDMLLRDAGEEEIKEPGIQEAISAMLGPDETICDEELWRLLVDRCVREPGLGRWSPREGLWDLARALEWMSMRKRFEPSKEAARQAIKAMRAAMEAWDLDRELAEERQESAKRSEIRRL